MRFHERDQRLWCDSCASGVVLARTVVVFEVGQRRSRLESVIVSGSTSVSADRVYVHCERCTEAIARQPDDEPIVPRKREQPS